MWIVCITSVRHVLTVNGYGGRQTKENEKSWCFKGWETLVITIAELARRLNFAADETALAAGWLARENKIYIERRNGLLYIRKE